MRMRPGVTHGGLKASNLLVDGAGRVTVTDFALPAPTPDALPAMPQYLSPEQVQGIAPDTRSDVFSLGALLFEMLAGRPPFGSPLTGSLSSVLGEHCPCSDAHAERHRPRRAGRPRHDRHEGARQVAGRPLSQRG
jgi:serine/threonine protein kinase